MTAAQTRRGPEPGVLRAHHDSEAQAACEPQGTAGCDCECGPHPPLTPPVWRSPHGVDLLDVEDRRRLNEVAALKRGWRVCDLPEPEGVTSS